MPIRRRPFALSLDPNEALPLPIRVATALVEAIRAGRIAPGEALPGTRSLAETLSVSRSTVVAAIQELEAEGWVRSKLARGTYVSDPLPERIPANWGAQAAPSAQSPTAFEWPALPSPLTDVTGGILNLRQGLPDPRLAPSEALAKAYQRAIRRHGHELLAAGEPKGNGTLRDTLAPFLAQRRGLRVDREQLLVTQGSQEALELLCDCLLEPGSVVAVEDPGRPTLWATLKRRPDIQVAPIPVDADGMDVDALEKRLEKGAIRMVVCSPLYQLPTMSVLSPARRAKLLALARSHAFVILEIDSDFDYCLEGQPLSPLAAADACAQTLHLGSLSHLIAPGMHLSFLAGPRALVDRLAKQRSQAERQGDRVLEWSVAELIRDEDLMRHLRRASMIYRERRDETAKRLMASFGSRLEVPLPAGGLAFWLRLMPGESAELWAQACRAQSLLLHPGRHYSYSSSDLPFLRMGFGELDALRLEEAMRRMKAAMV
jgi:GntR family transcriptional regulator/MocR family aminotransferase